MNLTTDSPQFAGTFLYFDIHDQLTAECEDILVRTGISKSPIKVTATLAWYRFIMCHVHSHEPPPV